MNILHVASEIAPYAKTGGLGVVASGNFSLTAALLQRFALMAAQHVPDFEIIDFEVRLVALPVLGDQASRRVARAGSERYG